MKLLTALQPLFISPTIQAKNSIILPREVMLHTHPDMIIRDR
jgi:hypothetical protein